MSALSPSDLGEDARQDYGEDFTCSEDQFLSNHSDTITNLPTDIMTGSDSVTMVSQDAFDAAKTVKTIVEKPEAFITPDEEARLFSAPGSDVNSPRDIVSPSAGSSPFSAMESDGEGIETGVDDASLSGMGDTSFQRMNGFFGAPTQQEYTTTPCASSSACDDDYESTGSRKKRRRTRRDMHSMYQMPVDNGMASLRFARAPTQEPWQHDQETSPFSPPTCPKGLNFNFAENNSRRGSGSASANTQVTRTECSDENAKRPRTSDVAVNGEELSSGNIPVKIEMNAMDTPVGATKSTVRRHNAHSHHRTGSADEEEQILLKQYPRKVEQFELKIVTQPESQHRARYLTEGSRGPVKDGTQRGFPEVQLIGYSGPAVLQVFVATDSGKVRPHGFYQACRVTGRNTSPCEETEIDGTKVIEIPFKQDINMLLSIDCVGILKLRNTDVEVRTGIRNPKRNQSVRLAFRACVPSPTGGNVILQNASSRISCTQPLGQPEITKKSVDRCSVEGGIEMFIIGKNFHRGTKVIYQDPEEPNGTQWSADGEVDKDTFHQSHMVVRVPPYHDQEISKPVNVQLLVEFQDKRCEPHSFTYTPRQKEPDPPKDEPKKVPQNQTNIGASNIESALHLFDGPIDKKFLVALFSKLLTAQPESPSMAESPEPPKPEVKAQLPAANVQTLTSPLINAVAAGPILQGMLQPLQTPTVVGIVPNEPMKSEVSSTNTNPASVPITTNPFANIQFTIQPKMSFTQDLNNAAAQTQANTVPLATPVTQMSFNSTPAQVTANPLSNISFTSVQSGSHIPISQVVFNPPVSASATNPNAQVTFHSVPAAGVSAPASQVNPNPLNNVGLTTSVFPSVGNMPISFGQNIKVKSETNASEVMSNAIPTNVQTFPGMTPVSNPPTAFSMCITQTTQAPVAFVEQTQEATPPSMVVSPVTQPQLTQGAVLYHSFPASHTETQPNAAPVFGSAPVNFVGNSNTQVGQGQALAFANLSSQSVPQAQVFSATSTPSQQIQTQPQPVTNFQVSPGQQMQQSMFASLSPNQNTPFGATNTTVSQSSSAIAQNVLNPVASYVPDHTQIGTTVTKQVINTFESSFVEKKSDQNTAVQMSQGSEVVQVMQNGNIVGSQQFVVPASQQQTQLQVANIPSQTQQQFKIAVHETAPMQQEQHRAIQERPQQNIVNFGIPNQQQFASRVTDHPMPQEQQTIVVDQQKIPVNVQIQQQPKPGFGELPQQQFSIRTQDQPMQQILQPAQTEIPQQPAFQAAAQGQPMTQQPGVQMSQPNVSQIVHVQQVLQTPVVTQSQRAQDNQMHVDPFVDSQSAQTNLQSQSSDNAFVAPQAGLQNSQPMEDLSLVTITSQTSDQHMKDISMTRHQQPPQQQPFKVSHQTVSVPVASQMVTSQPFQNQPSTISAPVAVQMQQTAVIQTQEFQGIQQPSNPSMAVAPKQNGPPPQQICSPNTSAKPNIIAVAVSPQAFQTQSNSPMPAEALNVAEMQQPQYQSPEPATKSSLPAAGQPGFSAVQAQTQRSIPNPEHVQMASSYVYQSNNNTQLQQQVSAVCQAGNNVTLQHHRVLAANLTVTPPMEPRSPDLFAMSQLLQSIDGSTNLETITGEDVRRHCQ